MKYFYSFLIFLLSLVIFIILDYGRFPISKNELINPVIFSSTICVIYLIPKSRCYILIVSAVLLILMIIAYLFQSLTASNSIGSIGFGILLITIASYLPQLIKKGFIEKY